MENVIREGELHLLMSEAQCDVLLSCKGCKLKAHKLLLYIASPVLQELLLENNSETTVLIFPEVNGSTMSLVLDFIYNGNVTVPSHHLSEFLDIVNLLKLRIDYDHFDNFVIYNKKEDFKCEKVNNKTTKEIPNLMPISVFKNNRIVTRKGLYNKVFPSPWCPRVVPLLADPREDYSTNENLVHYTNGIGNDTNNNFSTKLPCKDVAFLDKTTQVNKEIEDIHLKKDFNCTKLAQSNRPEAENNNEKPNYEESVVIYSSHFDNSTDIKVNEKTEGIEDPNGLLERNGKICLSRKSDKQKSFKCNDCGKSFSQLRNYKYHRSIHEGTKEFSARCSECGKVFNDKGYLSSHMKIHRDRKEYACSNCPKRFNQRVAYNMHMRIHTGLKPHECSTCGKSFSRKMLLKQHQRVHTGERPYSCPECGKCFADRSNMSLHARLHSGVKPYGCNLCSKSFTKKHHLKTHMNFHTGLKPYSCEKCGLSFSQSSNMRTHYKKCLLKSPRVLSP